MYEVIRWVSIVLLWVATATNLWSLFRLNRVYKKLKASYDVQIKILSDYEGRPYCYECEYYDRATVNDKGFLICPASGMEITAHDYCSYAERKTGQDLTSAEK